MKRVFIVDGERVEINDVSNTEYLAHVKQLNDGTQPINPKWTMTTGWTTTPEDRLPDALEMAFENFLDELFDHIAKWPPFRWLSRLVGYWF